MKTRYLFSAVLLSVSIMHASVSYTVTFATKPLIGHPAGPFSLAFQFADGGGVGDGNNAATISNFQFGAGGSASGTPALTGSATGDLSTQVVLTDRARTNIFIQPFTPGDQLQFVVSITTNPEPGNTPDGLLFAILDRTSAPIPTTLGAPLDGLLTITTTVGTGTTSPLQVFGSDPNRSPAGGGTPITGVTPPPPVSGSGCNGVYGGTFTGNLAVSPGQTCNFVRGRVTGSITQTGGQLVLSGSTIGGNVQIQGGTFSFGASTTISGSLQVQNLPASSIQNQICGVLVKGNLVYQYNGAPAEIGTTGGCPGNTVGSSVQVQGNTAVIGIYNNTVKGNLGIQNNTAGIMVYNNNVSSKLQCGGNTTIMGAGNKAQQKEGQCATY